MAESVVILAFSGFMVSLLGFLVWSCWDYHNLLWGSSLARRKVLRDKQRMMPESKRVFDKASAIEEHKLESATDRFKPIPRPYIVLVRSKSDGTEVSRHKLYDDPLC